MKYLIFPIIALAFSLSFCSRGDSISGSESAYRSSSEYRVSQTSRQAEVYLERGIERRENFGAAIEEFTRAIEIDPGYARAYDLRGRAKAAHLVRDYSGAIEDFSRAIEVDPEYTLAYMHRAFVQVILGNHAEAIEDYSRAIDIDPQYAVAYYQRGMSRLETGDRSSGCQDLARAASLGFGQAFMEKAERCY